MSEREVSGTRPPLYDDAALVGSFENAVRLHHGPHSIPSANERYAKAKDALLARFALLRAELEQARALLRRVGREAVVQCDVNLTAYCNICGCENGHDKSCIIKAIDAALRTKEEEK